MPNREGEESGVIGRQNEEIRRRRERIAQQAREMGLKPFRSQYSSIWIEQDQENKHYPTHFYSERYTEGEELELKEHRVTFPVPDLPTFRETFDALDTLYSRTVGDVSYLRHGVEGFMDFLEEFEKDQELKRLEENKLKKS